MRGRRGSEEIEELSASAIGHIEGDGNDLASSGSRPTQNLECKTDVRDSSALYLLTAFFQTSTILYLPLRHEFA